MVEEGHKCGYLHGHGYTMRVHVEGVVDPATGWVIDFAAMKAIVQETVINLVDHKHLNEVEGLENPTAENLAWWAFNRLRKSELHTPPHRDVVCVELMETGSGGVVVPS